MSYRIIERRPTWADLSLPKTNNLELAELYVAAGFVQKLEDIYVELTPEQIAILDQAVADHSRTDDSDAIV